MARHILQFDELHDELGWSCISIKDVGKIGNQWYTPARALGLNLEEYVEILVKQFKPDNITFTTFLSFSWKKQSDMRKYKNWINKRLREVKFYVD